MANILIVTRGLPSLIYPSVELGRRLAAANHRVTIAGDDDARVLARHHHLGFLLLEPDGYDAFLREDAGRSAIERLRTFRCRRGRARASLGVDGFAAVLRRDRPDLVLVNGEMHAHIIVAAAIGQPVALLNFFVSIWRQAGLPPPHHLARPGVGWKGTAAGMWLLWRNLRARKLGRRWLERARHAGCDRVSVLLDLARAVGFDTRAMDASQWLIPFSYRRLPILSLHALEFEFRHRPPDHVHYVGPMILAARPDRAPSHEDRARLEALFARRRDTAGERTLIYAGFGSVFTTDLAFLRRLIGIVTDRPGWDLVVSLSGRIPPEALGPLPGQVYVFPWVPQMDVLAHADVAITHGGVNSIDECVASGVPVLVYCGGETDMAGNTSRVVHHGIGIAGDRRRDDTSAIRARVDRLLGERRFRDNVDRLRQVSAAYVENQVAERTVETLLAAAPSTGERCG